MAAQRAWSVPISPSGTGEKAASAGISTEEMLSACAQPQVAVTAHRLGVPVNSAYRGMPAGASGSGERMQQMPKRSIPRVAGIACSAVSWLHDTWLNLCAVAIVAAGGWLAHQRLSMRWAQLEVRFAPHCWASANAQAGGEQVPSRGNPSNLLVCL